MSKFKHHENQTGLSEFQDIKKIKHHESQMGLSFSISQDSIIMTTTWIEFQDTSGFKHHENQMD